MNTEEGVVTPQAEDDTCFSQHLFGLLQFKGTRGDSKNNVKQFIVYTHVALHYEIKDFQCLCPPLFNPLFTAIWACTRTVPSQLWYSTGAMT